MTINPLTNKVCEQIKVENKSLISTYRSLMRQRWLQSTQHLPEVDKKDIAAEEPLINSDKVKLLSDRKQLDAEYKQTAYLRIRQQEESTLMFNYLSEK